MKKIKKEVPKDKWAIIYDDGSWLSFKTKKDAKAYTVQGKVYRVSIKVIK